MLYTNNSILSNALDGEYIVDDSAIKCANCGKRKSSFRKNFYSGPRGSECYFCIALFHTDIYNFCATIDAPKTYVTAIYADGGLLAMNRLGGVWAWCGVDDTYHRVIHDSGVVLQPRPSTPVTNNHTEQIAIVKALEAMPDGWSGTVYSDSNVAIGRVFDRFGTNNLPQNIIDRTEAAKRRLGKITAVLLQGHPTEEDLINGIGDRRKLRVSIHNHFCDILCEKEKQDYFEKNKEIK